MATWPVSTVGDIQRRLFEMGGYPRADFLVRWLVEAIGAPMQLPPTDLSPTTPPFDAAYRSFKIEAKSTLAIAKKFYTDKYIAKKKMSLKEMLTPDVDQYPFWVEHHQRKPRWEGGLQDIKYALSDKLLYLVCYSDCVTVHGALSSVVPSLVGFCPCRLNESGRVKMASNTIDWHNTNTYLATLTYADILNVCDGFGITVPSPIMSFLEKPL